MPVTILTSVISAAGALLVAVAGYVLTKRAEREAAWRDEKLVHYKEFVGSLSGIVKGDSTPEGQQRFARASNEILLFAPQTVIGALTRYQSEIGSSNPLLTKERHDVLLSALLFEIRRDLGVSPRDDRKTFCVQLWASGVTPNAQQANV